MDYYARVASEAGTLTVPRLRTRRGLLWVHYIQEDLAMAVHCRHCGVRLSLGKVAGSKGQTSTTMTRHLRVFHPEKMAVLVAARESLKEEKVGVAEEVWVEEGPVLGGHLLEAALELEEEVAEGPVEEEVAEGPVEEEVAEGPVEDEVVDGPGVYMEEEGEVEDPVMIEWNGEEVVIGDLSLEEGGIGLGEVGMEMGQMEEEDGVIEDLVKRAMDREESGIGGDMWAHLKI
jgi:hypothetical protein